MLRNQSQSYLLAWEHLQHPRNGKLREPLGTPSPPIDVILWFSSNNPREAETQVTLTGLPGKGVRVAAMAPKMAVTVQQATLADVREMANVVSAGFMDDDVFGRFMHPKRKEYPDDWQCSWQREIRRHLAGPATRNYVGVDDSSGRIAGFCLVKRLGAGASKLPRSLFQSFQGALMSSQNLWIDYTWTDRSADADAVTKFDNNWNDIEHNFSGPRKECWLIDVLCVHPDFQHRGIGRSLAMKAVELGEGEDPMVPVAVIASATGDRFYNKLGFKEVGRADVGDLKDVKGGSIKFYELHLKS